MACEQQLKKSQGTNMLPNVVATEQQSLIVVKKLLAIAVSCITYLRGLFPEKAYGSKYVEEQKVMILREERSCPGASQIVQWMHGCFDALQKKYLRLVVLSIYTDPENPQKVTECYQFRIQYTDKGPQMEFESRNIDQVAKMTCGNIRKASILLVRKLYMLMQNLGPLPDSVCLNMKLSYYDEVTPQDYEPPGFKEGDSDSMMFEKEPVNLTMGEIVTPFHTLKVDVTTERERLEQIPEDEPVSEAQRVALKMEADKAASISNSRPIKLCQLPVLKDRKDHNHNKADYLEVPLRSQKEMKVCEEKLDSSHIPEIDSLVKKTSDLGVTIKRTRSGRVIKSAMGAAIKNLELGCQLPVLKDRKDHNHNKADYLEVPLRSQKEMKVCEEKLDSSHIPEIDSLVKKTSDLGVTIKRTRSGRVIKSAMMSQFAFPCSQDKPSVPKKRKFSEPKEQF